MSDLLDTEEETGIASLEAREVGVFYNNPLGFVKWAFPWGTGELEGMTGPDKWQTQLLTKIGEELIKDPFDGKTPVLCRQFAVTSGHGVGKSALSSWIILWIMSTRPFSRGVVTANTGDQLRDKTWAELSKWKSLYILGHWFEYHNSRGNMTIYHPSSPKYWCVIAQTCREENSEAFAGLHGATSSPWYLFDEASAVPDKIWEVSDGGKTDGESFHFVFGNPTRSFGRFYDCFNLLKHRWITYTVDSRDSAITNKKYLQTLIEDWGIDSDYIRVRILGLFPSASDLQLIPTKSIDNAKERKINNIGDEPIIMGVDVARGGNDFCVIQLRQGSDARSFPKIRIPGSVVRDSMRLINIISEMAEKYKPDIINVDATGIGGPINDRLKEMGYPSREIHFGGCATNSSKFGNKTSEMWFKVREWLAHNGCIKNNDSNLSSQLAAREYFHDTKDRLVIESKKDMKNKKGSPDDADALVLTFATNIKARTQDNQSHDNKSRLNRINKPGQVLDYNPLFRG